MSDLKQIAGDLSKLLEEVKVKPVVTQEIAEQEEEVTEAPKEESETHSEVALEIVKTVFENAPTSIEPSTFGEALLLAATVKSEETNVSTREIVESVIDYLIQAIESAQVSLDEEESA